MDPDGLPEVELDPQLVESVSAQMAFSEALDRLRDAIAGNPEAETAARGVIVALRRWPDSVPVADDD